MLFPCFIAENHYPKGVEKSICCSEYVFANIKHKTLHQICYMRADDNLIAILITNNCVFGGWNGILLPLLRQQSLSSYDNPVKSIPNILSLDSDIQSAVLWNVKRVFLKFSIWPHTQKHKTLLIN